MEGAQQVPADCSPLEATINRRYDETMYEKTALDFYRGSDYVNYGYWEAGTDNGKDAGDRLMEELLDTIPSKQGLILDVACGKGETSKYLSRYYEPRNITGINISDKQLESCRANLPEATFLHMDAVEMGFEGEHFDAVICVEAAFHFNTRRRFLEEALRVLRPGGHLVLSDILRTSNVTDYHQRTVAENHLEGIHEYQQMLEEIGFQSVTIKDATEQCWHGHFRQAIRFGHERLLQRQISTEELRSRLEVYYQRIEYTQHYVLVSARKPVI
ncbi:class I SAM-dependent methyltransferase [Synechococcus sp. CBW1004]|uniref:class I SAM-dependent methyltransferase n=1 Tax=Synechococcus sp. CBW1004 TaxID=1353136 RepID=UPI0018CDB27D|nr:class I SAM-dependent methyltransferase [Synechococcus sp. CBW1004]QPN62163.1 methyltransferase domain-containing protein [Synechococcus sp. CBW1004]